MKLIVGLGNPGQQYTATRHNVGFAVVDTLAARLGWTSQSGDFDRMAKSRFDGLMLDGVLVTASGQEKLVILKPMTYMNLSGRAVQQALAFYQGSVSDLLVVLDDLALPCGKIRLRSEGSAGGHNGLKDIQQMLSTEKYARLRVGIDPVPPRMPQADYVLQRFSDEQRKLMEPAVVKAAACAVTWADKGISAAMNQFNSDQDASTGKSPAPAG